MPWRSSQWSANVWTMNRHSSQPKADTWMALRPIAGEPAADSLVRRAVPGIRPQQGARVIVRAPHKQ
eukprot:886873-Prorocentrum_minimum.AAC.1